MYNVEFNDEAVQRALARLAAGMDDMTDPMNDIGALLVRTSKDRIDRGVSPDGTAFAPLSQTTLDAYARRDPPAVSQGPLRLSGDMASQIFHDYGPTSAEVGSNAIQSAVMQFGAGQGAFGQTARGAPIPWGNIPARPFLGISEEDQTGIAEIVEEWLLDLATDS